MLDLMRKNKFRSRELNLGHKLLGPWVKHGASLTAAWMGFIFEDEFSLFCRFGRLHYYLFILNILYLKCPYVANEVMFHGCARPVGTSEITI